MGKVLEFIQKGVDGAVSDVPCIAAGAGSGMREGDECFIRDYSIRRSQHAKLD